MTKKKTTDDSLLEENAFVANALLSARKNLPFLDTLTDEEKGDLSVFTSDPPPVFIEHTVNTEEDTFTSLNYEELKSRAKEYDDLISLDTIVTFLGTNELCVVYGVDKKTDRAAISFVDYSTGIAINSKKIFNDSEGIKVDHDISLTNAVKRKNNSTDFKGLGFTFTVSPSEAYHTTPGERTVERCYQLYAAMRVALLFSIYGDVIDLK